MNTNCNTTVDLIVDWKVCAGTAAFECVEVEVHGGVEVEVEVEVQVNVDVNVDVCQAR